MTKSNPRPTRPTRPTRPSTQPLPRTPRAEDMKSWNVKEVLQWIQQRDPSILKGDDVDKFKKARIIGRAFLAFDIECFKSCGLPPAPLKDLADEVKEGNLSSQIARKRNDASKLSISPKRVRQEDPTLEWATRAREQRELIRKTMTGLNSSSDQHSNSDHPLPGVVDKLSDPTFEHKFAFPFIGIVPRRFKIDRGAEANWPYVGRIMFKKLLEELKMTRESPSSSAVWLYGTQGYGKSHLLAVLVCYLAAQDERVVYIPDCWEWLQHPRLFTQKAMLFAWADDITAQKEIGTLNTEDEIENFFKSQKNVIFVIDQMDALKGTKPKLHDWIMRFTANHKTVFSFSTHHADYLEQAHTKSSNNMLPVYGGLERTEMDQWWKRHPNIDMAGYEQSDVEDVTGCIPLLLDKCVVDRKIDFAVEDLRDICNEAVTFMQEIKWNTTECSFEWQWYLDYVTACFCRKSPPSEQRLDLIDHRYFYQLNGSGRCVCGLVRDTVAEQLLEWGDNFIDVNSLASLADCINNPSVVRFMIEHAVLSSIRSKGLAIGAGIGKSMEVKLLTKPYEIDTFIRGRPVLYWPRKLKFKTIDGIIVLISPREPQETRTKNAKAKRNKLLMFPFQITVGPATHANSCEEFFKEYSWWITGLSRFDVEVQFLWITPECSQSREYPADQKRKLPKYIERYIPFKVVDKEIWEKYEDAQKREPRDKAAYRLACP